MKEPILKQILMGEVAGDWRLCMMCRKKFIVASVSSKIKCPGCSGPSKKVGSYNNL